MDFSKFKWTREPESCTITDETVEIVTKPHTDLWQRTYYHFRNDNAPVFQMETEEKYFSFIVKTDFAESHHRFDQCGIVMYLDSENWLKGSIEYENEEYQRIVIKYLEDLLSCGVSKFRLDQYKHYSLPNEFNEGSFVKNVMCRYCKDMWIGEVLFEEDKQLFNEFTKYAYVHSMNGLDNNDRIVRAVENHDTYLNNDGIGYTRRLNDETIITEYGYLCGYAKHTMFYCRPFNNSWMDTRIKEANMR